nr:FAS-associated death domain protein isoform X2 [Kogia breviceps]
MATWTRGACTSPGSCRERKRPQGRLPVRGHQTVKWERPPLGRALEEARAGSAGARARERAVGRAGPGKARGGPGTAAPAAMDPFLVLLHSVSASLSSSELTELKFLCQSRVGKRKLERVQSSLDLFTVLLEQNEMSPENTVLLRELLVSLRRQDLLRRLEDFEAGAAGEAAPEERDLQAAFDIICDNVGKDWRKLARHLSVSDAKIEAIEEKYPRNLAEQESTPRRQLEEVRIRWFTWNGPMPSRRSARALSPGRKRKFGQRDTWGEHCVRTEAEVGGMQLQAQERQGFSTISRS